MSSAIGAGARDTSRRSVLPQNPPKGKGKGSKGKGGKDGKGSKGSKGKGKGEWVGFCSYCGKRGHGPRDCWTKQRDEETNGGKGAVNSMDDAGTNNYPEQGQEDGDIGGFDIAAVDVACRSGCAGSCVGKHGEIHRRQDPEPSVTCGGTAVDSVVSGGSGSRRGRITIDSGAAESVMPASEVPEVPIKESEGSRRGVNYVAANGSKMPNLGEKNIRFSTKDGTRSGIVFQITHTRKPLASVSKIVKKGNSVTFSPEGSHILNLRTGRKIDIEEANGTYYIDVEYMTGSRTGAGSREGFTRQA